MGFGLRLNGYCVYVCGRFFYIVFFLNSFCQLFLRAFHDFDAGYMCGTGWLLISLLS